MVAIHHPPPSPASRSTPGIYKPRRGPNDISVLSTSCYGRSWAQRVNVGVRGIWQEFKEFALKGSALSLAIGVIIGAAFGKIVDALVNDIIMPIVGIAGHADFSNYFLPLSGGVTATNLADARK